MKARLYTQEEIFEAVEKTREESLGWKHKRGTQAIAMIMYNQLYEVRKR